MAVTLGIKGFEEEVVTEELTATHIGGTVRVFATPMMITLMERVSRVSIKPYLDKGQDSVGTLVNVTHESAVPVGGKVTCESEVIGIDRWGKEYASFSKALCERNAQAEKARNTFFRQGDATRLEFSDETFDAVTSNYVYHNISGDRQKYLLETLRTLKKGGTFAIHDIFSPSKYGDMQAFLEKLKAMGYQKAGLIDTTNGKFMRKSEARWMALSGSAILTGIK